MLEDSYPVNYLMETYRLQCMNDHVMQALYRNEINWCDIPDDDPPLELDNWREYNERRQAKQVAAELEQWRQTQTGSKSVPSSPIHRSTTDPWGKRSTPTTPSAVKGFQFPPLLSTCPDLVLPVPPATPTLRPVQPYRPPLRKPISRILDAIREVDSASHTPERTPSPLPPLIIANPILHNTIHNQPDNESDNESVKESVKESDNESVKESVKESANESAKEVATKQIVPREVNKTPELMGSWRHRSELLHVISAAPILNCRVEAVSDTRLTVVILSLPRDTTKEEITIAAKQHGKLDKVMIRRVVRTTRGKKEHSIHAFIRYHSAVGAASACTKGIVFRKQQFSVEYTKTQLKDVQHS